MFRKLWLGGALLCALASGAAFAGVAHVLGTGPFSSGLMGAALTVGLYGLAVLAATGRTAALTATGIALAGLALVVVAIPADAAGKAAPTYSSISEALAAVSPPPALAAPIPTLPAAAPAPVVVQLAAQPAAETSIALPVNEWISVAFNFVSTLAVAVFGTLAARLPKPLLYLVKLYGVQRIVDQAVAIGINAVPGAVKDQPLTIDVGSKVLASALQWAVDEVPGFVLKLAGGEDGLKAKIYGALHLEADASAAEFGVKTA